MMPIANRLSLRTRATLIAVSIIVLSVAGVATTSLVQIRRQIAAEQERSAGSLALSVARASELPLAVRDSAELSRLANSFVRAEGVLFIAIYSDRQEPIAVAAQDMAAWNAQREGRPGKACLTAEQPVEAATQSNEFAPELDSPTPTTVGALHRPVSATVGRVVVGLSTRAGELAQRRQTQVMLIVALMAGLIGTVILFLTLGAWLRRLARLATTADAISRGDFSTSAQDLRNDEIGRLAQTFDSMRLALRHRDLQLRDFNATLQQQVKERTAALEQALVAAEQASTAKSLFLANMSHELRTPLNGVIGMVDLLLTTSPNSQQERYAQVAKSSAHSLLDLINDILDFSKIEAGRLELDITDFSLWGLLDDVMRMFGPRVEKKGLELAYDPSPKLPDTVGGDPTRIRQVLLNLLSNSLKFTEHGEVVLEAAVEVENDSDALVRFAVRDTGIGIPPDRLDRLFKSFSQVDASTTRKYGGTGLGLAISQRIVSMMGGQIGVQSVVGRGSTFWFTVRLQKRQQNAGVPRPLARDPHGLRVLVVDDNATNREILKSQLASWSLQADLASGAQEAMQMLHSAAAEGKPYSLALLDMHMPNTDGMQLASQMKSDPAGREAILIALSSIGDDLHSKRMKDAGFAACLTKPALPSALYNAIVESLSVTTQDAPAAAPAPIARGTPVGRLDGYYLLLAEDNDINRMVASEILTRVGARCDAAENGREALAAATKTAYDAILMDCQMPEMDGFEATAQIRKDEAREGSRRNVIIALTANAVKGDRERCLSAGMDGYVSKPIDPATLIQTIRSLAQPANPQAQTPHAAPAQAAAAAPAPRVVADASPAVDLHSLQERCMGNRVLASKALGKFESNTTRDLADLAESLKGGNAAAVASVAHKIKGSAANVSAEDVRKVAAELEMLAKNDGLLQAEACLSRLTYELVRLREFLPRALEELSAEASPVGTEAAGAANAAPGLRPRELPCGLKGG